MSMSVPAHIRPDHDETLIARLAADDLTPDELANAEALVASCPACAELDADLRSIMAATASLPAPARTRDFQLTEADAARLRRTGWRRILGRLGEPGLAFTRPLATGLVALGIAGLVLAAAPSFLSLGAFGTAGAAPAPAGAAATLASGGPTSDQSLTGQVAAGVSPAAPAAASAAPASAAPASSAPAIAADHSSEPSTKAFAASPQPPPNLGLAGSPAPPSLYAGQPETNPSDKSAGTSGAPTGPSALLVISVGLLGLGIGLFLLRWAARRTA